MTRTTLFEIDLTPMAENLIDLLGASVPECFSHFGTCHGSRIADWTPELGAKLAAAYDAAMKVVDGAKRPELVAFLISRGRDAHVEEKRSSLRARCMIAINEARSPSRFVNAAPNEWLCGCGYVGPMTYREIAKNVRVPVCPGEGCTRPHYTMQLTARIAARRTA